MNITIEALESYLSDRYGGCSIVKSSPVVSTKGDFFYSPFTI